MPDPQDNTVLTELSTLFYSINAMSLVDAAVRYGQLGFHVFPLQANAKLPQPGWGWTQMNSRDEDTIRQWWRIFPDANIGLVCGEASSINVLDIDMKNGADGIRSYQAIVQEPYTGPVQQTPTGGQHLLFGYRPGFKNFTHKGELGGLDMRTDNGYIVVAPSVTSDGPYQWAQGGQILAMPEKLQIACTDWSRAANTVTVDAPDVPEDLVNWQTLNLHEDYVRYLYSGDTTAWDGDESRAIFATAGALMRKLNDPGQVFGILTDNEHAYACAERHRQHGNPADWLWKYGISKMVTAATMPDVGDLFGVQSHPGVRGDGEQLEDPMEAAAAIADDSRGRSADNTIAAAQVGIGNTIQPRRFLYGHRIMSGYVTMVAAPGGVGKSMIMVVDGLSMASGRQLLYDKPVRQLRVAYLCNEDDLDELRRRVVAAKAYHEITDAELGTFDLISGYGAPRRLYVEGETPDQYEDRLAQWVARFAGYDVLMLDPLISLHQGVEENSNEGMELVSTALRALAHRACLGLMVAAHTRKGSGDSESHAGQIDSMRGASAVKDAARISRTIARMSKKSSDDLKLDWQAVGRHMVRMDSGKLNFSAPDAQASWMMFHEVDLHNGDGVYPSDKIGVPAPVNIEEITPVTKTTDVLAAVAATARALMVSMPEGSEISCRKFSEAHAGTSGPFGMGEKALRNALRECCEEGLLACRTEANTGVGGLSYFLIGEGTSDAPSLF